ncbi:ligase-associated DNA damage response endonuclease PdeM [Yoonia ponticola]
MLAKTTCTRHLNTMNAHVFTFNEHTMHAEPTGALWLPEPHVLVVSDLHFGKSDRIARRTGTLIPPYENLETLNRLDADITRLDPKTVICLGDSFDDLDGVEAFDDTNRATLTRLQAGRKWVWIEGNHDPGPVNLGGTHVAEYSIGSVAFRHIASAAVPEVSGHYHPKHGIAGKGRQKPCFIYDKSRLILPAYGAYTGGLSATHPDLRGLFDARAIAVLTGPRAIALPLTAPKLSSAKLGR